MKDIDREKEAKLRAEAAERKAYKVTQADMANVTKKAFAKQYGAMSASQLQAMLSAQPIPASIGDWPVPAVVDLRPKALPRSYVSLSRPMTKLDMAKRESERFLDWSSGSSVTAQGYTYNNTALYYPDSQTVRTK